MHLFAKVVPQVPLPPLLKQHKPDPLGVLPIGHVPLKLGVVQVPPVAARLHLNCSACASRHIFPPVTLTDVEATTRLNDTLALPPQLVPIRHDEKATPVAEAQFTPVPSGPVPSSVFWSFVPT